jgi:hypothetical protein
VSGNVKIGIQLTGVQQTENSIRGVNAQLEKTAALLSKISGRNISGIDAGVGEVAFNQMRRISSGLRGYNGLADFLDSPAATLRDSTARGRAYRDNVLRSLFGTSEDALRERGPGWRVEHPRGGFVAGAAHGAAKQFGLGKIGDFMKSMRGGGAAEEGGGMMGAFKGGAAFGTGAIAAQVALKAVAAAAKIFVAPALEEAKAIDLLKRRTGDLGGSFGTLMKQVNKASDGLGVTYQEAAKLAVAQTRVAGNFYGGDLRAALGFARSTGMDLGGSVDFFGTMRRMGDLGRGENEMKRFAYLVGEAVSASGYSGQVEAITKAVAAFATTSARFGLSTPNVDAYLGAFAGLTRTGLPGLDPEGAAMMLGRADSTVRAGGGGRWGQAFLMGALGTGGDPYATQALYQQGLFGTGAGAFSGPWAQMTKQFGGTVPGGTLATNFSKIRAAFRRVMAGTGSAAPAAFAQLLGLPSAAQGAALYEMSPVALDNLMQSLGSYGISLKNISATGMADFGKVNAARGVAGLMGVRGDFLNRADLSQGDRAYLSALNGSMSEGALRQALGRFALTREQEDTPVTVMRRWGADLQNTITGLGDRLLSPLNGILNATNRLAGIDNILGSGFMSSGNAPSLGLSAGMISGPGGFGAFAAALANAESSGNPLARNGNALGLFQFKPGTWARYGGAGLNIFAPQAQMKVLANEMADAMASGATTIQDLTNFHHYGSGGWQGRGADAEVQRVEHHLVIELTSGGKTIATKTLPLRAGQPLIPAGGATITAPGP